LKKQCCYFNFISCSATYIVLPISILFLQIFISESPTYEHIISFAETTEYRLWKHLHVPR
jgi:hypothetical protein